MARWKKVNFRNEEGCLVQAWRGPSRVSSGWWLCEEHLGDGDHVELMEMITEKLNS